MRKRKLAVLLTAAAVSLSACIGSQTQENKTAQTSQETVTAENAGTEAADGTKGAADREAENTEMEKNRESGAEAGDAEKAEQASAKDWASRAIEEGKVSSREELTFSIGEQVSGTFTGTAYLAPMIMNDETYHFPQTNNVTFEPGARSCWHSHGGMILVGTGGVGYYQEEGKPVQVLYPGDVALCPPGEKHWHGGSADTSFAHIAVNTNPELTGLEWFDRISDEEYAGLPSEKPEEAQQ